MLTKIETEILSVLFGTDGKSNTIRAIEKRTNRSYATVHSTIKTMEGKELLKTKVSGRKRSVELTDKGRIIAKLISNMNDCMNIQKVD